MDKDEKILSEISELRGLIRHFNPDPKQRNIKPEELSKIVKKKENEN